MPSRAKPHLFIDTNIFLSFYACTQDDVEELKKLTKLITTQSLTLYLTEQTRDEFYRNRESKIRESLKSFQSPPAATGVPRFMAAYPSIKVYRRALTDLSKARDAAMQQARNEAKTGSLAADILFSEISDAANLIPTTSNIFEAASRRMALGSPPGKAGSLGDRINWETLLAKVPHDVDLHLISKDGDFGSPLQLGAADAYLLDEWKTKKNGNLYLHEQLKPFLAQHFPQIQLAVDVEKRAAMDRLINSGSFATTHAAISNLQQFVDVLTPGEMSELLKACEANSQIAAIGLDPDVRNFYVRIISSLHSQGAIDSDEYTKLLSSFDFEVPKCGQCGAPNALEAADGAFLCDKCYGEWIETRGVVN